VRDERERDDDRDTRGGVEQQRQAEEADRPACVDGLRLSRYGPAVTS
jgi:hypothetical protein